MKPPQPRTVGCEHCGMPPGMLCRDAKGQPTLNYHASRWDAARDAAAPTEYPACACGRTRPHLAGPDCSSDGGLRGPT